MDYVLWLVGLALTVLALSLFAMFWFDLLKRFTGVRSAGPPTHVEGRA